MDTALPLICAYMPCSQPFQVRRPAEIKTRKYCSSRCSAKARPLIPLAERLWSRVTIAGPDDCWEWQGWRRAGYGQMYVLELNAERGTHAIAWFLHHGVWPTLDICHHCDNPPCCNIAHLFEGTAKDNAQDMVRKGRHSSRTHPEKIARGDLNGSRKHPERLARGENHGTHTHPEKVRRGEANNLTKLTDHHRAELLHLYHVVGWSIPQLAERYNVSRQAIRFRLKHDKYP